MMDAAKAIELIESDPHAEEDELIEAWQHLLDSGLCWQLQGYYGRTATQLIEAGVITPPTHTNRERP